MNWLQGWTDSGLTWSTNSQTHMHSDSCAVTRAENGVPASDDVTTRNNRSFQHRLQVSLGVLLVMAGLVFFVTMGSYTILIGLAIVFLGLLILIRAFCVVIKSSHVAVPGHFLLHPRTGTRYTHHQAIAVQRRLDRIRRATAEDHSTVQMPPASDASPQSQPATPPPWQMEPPPSYETVMKTTIAVNQL
ncbi:uncharacterized protein isoform X1 [Danio rerio]|uniref:Si:dkeyp-51f12.3 n=1 Tax=Danio rerio TaxID=7955 RepID=R4GDP3_DANRE|nr:uncharacterized protein LOC107988041 [Danio rerio]|eukprot:NP_001315068.1 uncharacterized protein LOC107988041 [Danio rerio]